MLELNNQIARLDLRTEHLRRHLRSIDRNSPDADDIRSDLLSLLQVLAVLKGERQRLEAEYRLEVVT
jgi:hypothetical protein